MPRPRENENNSMEQQNNANCSEKKNRMKTQWKHFVATCKMKAISKNLGTVEQKKNH